MKNIIIFAIIMLSATTVFAQFGGGSGTENDPYLIVTAEHLYNVRYFPGDHFAQTNDIDLIEYDNWQPIGDQNSPYWGNYYGNEYSIYNLNIYRPTSNNIGLFGYTSGLHIEDLNLINVSVTGQNNVGALIGRAYVEPSYIGLISDISVSGAIIGADNTGGLIGDAHGIPIVGAETNVTIEADDKIGGIVGKATKSFINDSYSNSSIIGSSWVGSIVGYSFMSFIYYCHSDGEVIGDVYIGGITGENEDGMVEDNFTRTRVEGNDYVGGLVGICSGSTLSGILIADSYAIGEVYGSGNVGGLLGSGAANIVVNSYWNTETTGQTTSAGGEGRTTAEMTYPYEANTYIDWDFEEIWYPDIAYEINNGYPFLQWQTGGKDLSVFIYSNIDIENAEIKLNYGQGFYDSIISDLDKGWNEIEFDNVPNYDEIGYWEAEATATGVGGETYTYTTNNVFEFNEETRRWENNDIEFVFENKRFHNDYNWVSFPKLDRTGNDPVNAIPVLESIYEGYDELQMEYDTDSYVWYSDPDWSTNNHPFQSSDGVIINIAPEVDSFRVYEVEAQATRLSDSSTITLNQGINYIGYWVPNSQRKDDAFGEHWDKVEWMKYEDWYYDGQEYPDSGNQSQPLPSGKIHSLHYGEGYIVYLNEEIRNFGWNVDSADMAETFNKEEPQYFTVEKDFDYQAIDVIDIPEDVIEIGVHQDRSCVGAVVVEEPAEQILVYADYGTPLSFELITAGGSRSTISQYGILDPNTGRFREGQLTGGMYRHTIISLAQDKRFDKGDIAEASVVLHPNYPNPANPETTFSFTLAHKQDVELTVYNIRGQKVRTVYEGSADEGAHSIVWNGKDSKGRVVSSGVYFYKLKTESAELTEKLILLK